MGFRNAAFSASRPTYVDCGRDILLDYLYRLSMADGFEHLLLLGVLIPLILDPIYDTRFLIISNPLYPQNVFFMKIIEPIMNMLLFFIIC